MKTLAVAVILGLVGIAGAAETTLTKNPDETVTKAIKYEKSEVQEKIAELKARKEDLQAEKQAMVDNLNAKIDALTAEIDELRATVE